jgi:hypothetical protein
MSNEVFANNMEVSCKAADGKSICCFPDVCFTPPQTPATPPGVPIPYPNTGLASDTSDGSRTVKISRQEVMLKNKSYFKKSTGDEAGNAPKKGVITSTNRGKVYFIAWSMDVKVEGENVVRHLDMTTHNHGSNTNTGPWPYADKMALKPGGACNKAPNDYANQVTENCTEWKDKKYSEACCDCKGRKCMMMPYNPNHCCSNKDGTQLTPHHPIPFQDHYETGTRKLHPSKWDSLRRAGAGQYNGDDAPCICCEGSNHQSKEDSGEHMQHGRMGRAFAHYRDSLPGKTYKYADVREKAAEIVATEMKCDKECIQAQMDEYHDKRVGATGDLHKSPQPRVKGDKYLDDYDADPIAQL